MLYRVHPTMRGILNRNIISDMFLLKSLTIETIFIKQVTHLEITRPSHFSYQPGDYLFIQIPDIAQHEWHPFTISSAPEMEGENANLFFCHTCEQKV